MNSLYVIAAAGILMFLLLVFQVLVGKRVIRFKGKLHMRVHRLSAYTLLVLAAFHGVYAMGTLVFDWF